VKGIAGYFQKSKHIEDKLRGKNYFSNPHSQLFSGVISIFPFCFFCFSNRNNYNDIYTNYFLKAFSTVQKQQHNILHGQLTGELTVNG